MKTKLPVAAFLLLITAAAYCGGLSESDLVNVQEIALANVNSIAVSYTWERISLFNGTSDTLIIKEYMSRDNSRYYAAITNDNGALTVKKGRRPLGILFNTFDVRVEVYLPAAYPKAVAIKAGSGKIEAGDEFTCKNISIENSSGSISLAALTAEQVNLKTSSGSIAIGNVSGDASAESSSGRIEINTAGGALTVKTSSGSIRCTVSESAGDLSLTSSSGSITLNVPETLGFNFSARSSSGSLSTPFPEKLVSPVTDRHTIQGAVNGGGETTPTINIRTGSGSVRVRWAG